MEMKPVSVRPIRRRGLGANKAWAYINDKSVDVYVYKDGNGDAIACRITRQQMRSWMAKLERSK